MPKPSEILNTPEAISRVGGNEDLKTELEYVIAPAMNYVSDDGEWKVWGLNHTLERVSHHADLDDVVEQIYQMFKQSLTTKDQEKEEAIAKARDQEAKLWFETWYSHYLSPTKPLTGEFARFATERIQMTGYERDQALPTEDNN